MININSIFVLSLKLTELDRYFYLKMIIIYGLNVTNVSEIKR